MTESEDPLRITEEGTAMTSLHEDVLLRTRGIFRGHATQFVLPHWTSCGEIVVVLR
jgi:hypothetical protein